MNLVIVDLGCGNIGSVLLAFERFGLKPLISGDAEKIATADKVILPGVGAAGYAMKQIGARNLRPVLLGLDQPVLGICLGMQILFDRSEEDGAECLGVMSGNVRKLPNSPERPVPHMGWSRLEVSDESIGLRSGDYVYFAHSFACEPTPEMIASAEYGLPVPAVVRKKNWLGAQFHPERSGEAGARFLEGFLKS